MLISHDLLKTQKTRKQHLRVTVELYDYATELYNELSRIGIIEQLSNVPQLGAIRVEHKLEKSRYDYVILQLYLHQLVQENLGKNLKFTYGSGIRLHEFGADESKLEGIGAISVADIVQVLTLAYNIGHFYNTFVSSRAVIMMANANETFRQLLYNGSTDERFSQVLETYLADKNYLRFHLLNSLLVLDKCNPDLYSVKLAREILYAYINEDALEQNNKLKYAFSIFRSIRSVAYIAYDLQVAKVSFTIDLNDEKAMILLLGELLSQYNDRRSSTQLIQNKDKICSSFSSKAFSGVIFEAMNWKWSCRYQCRGICRGEENAKFLIFELDESRILIRKNQYEQIEDRSMNLKCRLYRSKWVQSITVSDVMESGQVVENPMIGAIPSRNEVQRELDDLLMSM